MVLAMRDSYVPLMIQYIATLATCFALPSLKSAKTASFLSNVVTVKVKTSK